MPCRSASSALRRPEGRRAACLARWAAAREAEGRRAACLARGSAYRGSFLRPTPVAALVHETWACSWRNLASSCCYGPVPPRSANPPGNCCSEQPLSRPCPPAVASRGTTWLDRLQNMAALSRKMPRRAPSLSRQGARLRAAPAPPATAHAQGAISTLRRPPPPPPRLPPGRRPACGLPHPPPIHPRAACTVLPRRAREGLSAVVD